MSTDFQDQIDIANSLIKSLNSILENNEHFKKNLQNQVALSQDFSKTAQSVCDEYQKIGNSFKNLLSDLDNLQETTSKKQKELDDLNRGLIQSSKKSQTSTKEASEAGAEAVDSLDSMTDSHNKRKSLTANYNNHIKKYEETNFFLRQMDKAVAGIAKAFKNMGESFKALPIVKRALKTYGFSLLWDIPKLILTGVFKILGSLIGAVTNLFKTTLSLPFMIAKIAVDVGNGLRKDIIEGIGNAYQSTKEYSDANSLLGQGISNLRDIVVGSIKTFENPTSTLTKLFGYGNAGAQKFLQDVSKAIDDMGPLAELYGHQVTNSSDSAVYLTVMMRGLGISSKEISYYALDAGTQNMSIYDRLENLNNAVQNAAKMNDVDAKQVAIGVQKLRTNIKDFGHLTDVSLSNLVSRMRQLNVEADDLAGIFGKFTSFEDAAKTSAMLYQSFGMHVDTLTLLTAHDPGEIVDEFRDAMFATGKSYGELNRHEKALLSQTTGLNDAMLKSIMSFNNMHLSYGEIKDQLADDDPTEKQIKSISELTSSIKEIQKVMNFKSPFDAFFKGLAKNSAASTTLKQAAMAISSLYQHIYTFGLTMDADSIRSITTPLVLIVRKFNDVFSSQAFLDVMKIGTGTIANIFGGATGGLGSHRLYGDVIKMTQDLYALEGSVRSSTTQKEKKALLKKLKPIIEGGDKSLIEFLQDRNMMTKDGKFAENLTTSALLSTIKSASIHINSSEGEATLNELSNALNDFQNDTLIKYTHLNVYNSKKGIQASIDMTTDDLIKMYEKGNPLFGSIFNLGRNILGGIIKGIAIGVTSLMTVLTSSLDTGNKSTNESFHNYLKKYYKIKPGENFTILSWLGISEQESDGLNNSLKNALKSVMERTPKLFDISSQFLIAIGSVMIELANAVMTGFANFFVPAYDNMNALEKSIIRQYIDIDKIKIQQGLKLNLKDTSAKAREAIKNNADEYIFGPTLGKHEINKIQRNLKNLGNYNIFKSFVKKLNSQRSASIDQAYNDGARDDEHNYAVNMANFAWLQNFKKMESELFSVKEWFNFINTVNKGFPGNSSEDKIHLLEKYTAHFIKEVGQKSPENYFNKYVENIGFGRLSDFDEKLAHKNTADYADIISGLIKSKKATTNLQDISKSRYFHIDKGEVGPTKAAENLDYRLGSVKGVKFYDKKPTDSMNDGALSIINSMLGAGGLKLFTADGKVIVPHSLDELVNVSEKDQTALGLMFSNLSIAFESAANAKSVYKQESLSRENIDYKPNDELISEFLQLTHETLSLAINRKININKHEFGVKNV